jgi:exodeoxyribonuclease VII small subunit
MPEQELTYEQALELLDRSLRSLEEGDLSLEAALQAVDDSRKYLLICEARLEEAKRKIEVRPAGDSEPAPDSQELFAE